MRSIFIWTKSSAGWHHHLNMATGERLFADSEAFEFIRLLPSPLSAVRRAFTVDRVGSVTNLEVTGGAVGIRTSELSEPVTIEKMTVSGVGSVGIVLD